VLDPARDSVGDEPEPSTLGDVVRIWVVGLVPQVAVDVPGSARRSLSVEVELVAPGRGTEIDAQVLLSARAAVVVRRIRGMAAILTQIPPRHR
jgi:hypothetical protein